MAGSFHDLIGQLPDVLRRVIVEVCNVEHKGKPGCGAAGNAANGRVYIAANDPKTALTQTALRRLVKTGAIPSVRIGTKYLVALEAVEEYLQGSQQAVTKTARGAIRQVEV